MRAWVLFPAVLMVLGVAACGPTSQEGAKTGSIAPFASVAASSTAPRPAPATTTSNPAATTAAVPVTTAPATTAAAPTAATTRPPTTAPVAPAKPATTTATTAVRATTTAPAPVRTTAAEPEAKRYANCTALNADYPHGVGRNGAVDKVSGSGKPVTTFTRNDALYAANTSSDRDGDGIACEKA